MGAGNALAQTLNPDGSEAVWAATMTVGTLSSTLDPGVTYVGYDGPNQFGSLEPSEFTYDGETYVILWIRTLEGANVAGCMTNSVQLWERDGQLAGLGNRIAVLQLGGHSFPFADAVDVNSGGSFRTWCGVTAADLGWSVDDTIDVKIIRVATPTAPLDVAADNEGANWVLSWTAPAMTGGWVEYQYRSRAGDGGWGDWTDVPESAPGGANAAGYTLEDLSSAEAHEFEVRARNGAGNSPAAAAVWHNVPEIVAVSVRSSPRSGDTYGLHEAIELAVTFDGPVRVEGTELHASLFVDDWRRAEHYGGSGTDTLRFRYAVKSGDADTDGVSFGANALAVGATPSMGPKGGGTIRSPTGQDADLSNASQDFPAHKVDATRTGAPMPPGPVGIWSATLTAGSLQSGADGCDNGVAGKECSTLLSDDEFTHNNVTYTIDYLSKSALSFFIGFEHDLGTDAEAFTLEDGFVSLEFADADEFSARVRFWDDSGIEADWITGQTVSLSIDVTAAELYSVDLVSAPANGTDYLPGEAVRAAASFAKPVAVDTAGGAPGLTLNIGGIERQALYEGGTGTAALAFAYTVAFEDVDVDGIEIPADALALDGAAIVSADGAGAAALTHAARRADAAHKVKDRPHVTAMTMQSDPGEDGHYGIGEEFEIRVTFSEEVQTSTMVITTEQGPSSTALAGIAELGVTVHDDDVNTYLTEFRFFGFPQKGTTGTDEIIAKSLRDGDDVEPTQNRQGKVAYVRWPDTAFPGHGVDGVRPEPVPEEENPAALSEDRARILLTFTEALSPDTAPASAFQIAIGSAPAVEPSAVSASEETLTLTLADAPTPGDDVSVSYMDPTGGDDPAAIQDARAGNDAEAFTQGVPNPPQDDVATLRDLTIANATETLLLDQEFDSALTDYTAPVGDVVDTLTVKATPTADAAAVLYLDAADTELIDADAATAGFQVSLPPGRTAIQVRVTSVDTTATTTYTLNVTRKPGCVALPTGRLWSACLTVGATSTPMTLFGYDSNIAGNYHGDALSATAVTLPDDTSATVDVLTHDNATGELTLNFSGDTSWIEDRGNRDTLSLHVGARTYAFGDAAWSDATLTWSGPRLGWANADAVVASITDPDTAPTDLATLKDLAIASATETLLLDRAFDSVLTAYTASVADAVDTLTVKATPTDALADVTFLGAADAALIDADTVTDGFQVSLPPGRTAIQVRVVSVDTTETTTYTLDVTRKPGCAAVPTAVRLWKACLTVGATSTPMTLFGYALDAEYFVGDALTETVVTLPDGSVAEVSVLSHDTATGELRLNFSGNSNTAWLENQDNRDTLSLHVGARTYAFADAAWSDATLTWSGLRLGWANADAVLASITDPVTAPTDLATLKDLTIASATETLLLDQGTFDSALTAYTASVADAVETLTVKGTPTDEDASVSYLDAADAALTDADSLTDGFQVSLPQGRTQIGVRVTSEDETATTTYTLAVTRKPGCPAVPTGRPWSACLTVGATSTSMTLFGYAATAGEYVGDALSATAVTLPDATSATVSVLTHDNATDELRLIFSGDTSWIEDQANRDTLNLHLGGDTFAFADGTWANQNLTLSPSGLDWANADAVLASITDPDTAPSDPPGPPRSVSASAGTGKVTLAWAAPESPGDSPVTHYEYRRKEGDGAYGNWTRAETVAFQPYSHSTILGEDGDTLADYAVAAETAYTYELRAVNAAGGGGAAVEIGPATTGEAIAVRIDVPAEVEEDAESFEVLVVAEVSATDPNTAKYDLEIEVSIFTESESATAFKDFKPLGTQVIIAPGDFEPVSGGWLARKAFQDILIDDSVVEPDEETFKVGIENLGEAKVHPFVTIPDATAIATVTILDDDAADWTVAFEPTEINESEGVNASTLTVSAGGVTFPEDRSIVLEIATGAGQAIVGVDFTLTDADGAALAAPYTLTLEEGESEVAATVTSIADDVSDADETVEVTATLDGESIGNVAILQILTIDPPGAPRNVNANALTGFVLLGWDAPESEGDSEITHYEYRLKRGAGDFEAWTLVEDKEDHVVGRDGTALTFYGDYIVPNETRTYEVRAVNAGGPGPAAASDQIELPPPTVFRVEHAEVRVAEDAGTATVNATLEVPAGNLAPEEAVELVLTATAGTASDPEDFEAQTATVSIGKDDFNYDAVADRWVGTGGVAFAIVDNRLTEGEESFTVAVSRAGSTPGWIQPHADAGRLAATVTIEDDDVLAWSVTPEPDTIGEEGGVSTVWVRTDEVELTEDKTIVLTLGGNADVTTDFTLTDSDGAALTDPYTLTLTKGEVEVAATVTALADAVFDDDETVTFTARIGTEQIGETATLTISEIDAPGAPRSLSASAGTGKVTLAWQAPESEGGAPIGGYAFQRKQAGGDYGAWREAGDADARGVEDYDVAGETAYTYRVRAVNRGGGGEASGEAEATTGEALTVRLEVQSMLEEAAGELAVAVVAELPSGGVNSVKYERSFKVLLTSVSGTAVSPEDYASLNEILTFAPGDFEPGSGGWIARKARTVAIVDDAVAEAHETFDIAVAKGTTGAIATAPFVQVPDETATETVTILNDDEPPIELIVEVDGTPVANNVARRAENVGTVAYAVRAVTGGVAPPTQDFVVTFNTLDRTAKSPGDYVAPALTYAFNATDFAMENVADGTARYVRTVSKNIEIVDDEVVERSEYFEVVVDSDALPGYVTIGSDYGEVVIQINNEDTTSVRVLERDVTVEEGEEFQVALAVENEVEFAFSVYVAIQEEDGSPADRYIDFGEGGFSHRVGFSEGQRQASVAIETVEDRVVETEVRLDVLLERNGLDSNISLVNDPGSTVTITDDDHAPEIAMRQPKVLVGETEVGRLRGSDADGDELSWSTSVGGPDGSLFTLTAGGLLELTMARTLEAPGDADNDGFYEIEVEVSDGVNDMTRTIMLELVDAEPPSTPKRMTVGAGDGGATAYWSVPADDGNAPVLRYEYWVHGSGRDSPLTGRTCPPELANDERECALFLQNGEPGDWTAVPGGAAARQLAVGNLTNGKSYQFKVRAVNVAGAGMYTWDWATPYARASEAPELTVTLADRTEDGTVTEVAVATWTEPDNDTGLPLVGYIFEGSRDGVEWGNADGSYRSDTFFALFFGSCSETYFSPCDPESETRRRVLEEHMTYWHFRVQALYSAGTLEQHADAPEEAKNKLRVSSPYSNVAHIEAPAQTAEAEVEQPPLTAQLQHLPHGHTGAAFEFRIVFSEAVAIDADALRDRALEVTGGAVTAAARVEGEPGAWTVTVQPDSTAEVRIELAAAGDCAEPGAVCTADGRGLSHGLRGLVPGPPPAEQQQDREDEEAGAGAQVDNEGESQDETEGDTQDDGEGTAQDDNDGDTEDDDEKPQESVAAKPLTARFLNVPAKHDGVTAFTFRVRFSEDVPMGYAALRDAFDVLAGRITGARRVNGRDDLREITVKPTHPYEIVVELQAGRACSRGGVCTADGRTLSNTPSATVAGPPPELSVADGEATEAAGATVRMAVTLSWASESTVTVDYATADGSARAGEDYEAASGTLTFRRRETSKTVSVRVLDDAVDEGKETFRLVLSNASGARIADAEAVGTIDNSDPLPQAWLARFGRTASDHALQAIEGRWRDGRQAPPETRLTIGGRRMDGLWAEMVGEFDRTRSALDGAGEDEAAQRRPHGALAEETRWARMDRLKVEAMSWNFFGGPAGGNPAGGNPAGGSLAGGNPAGGNPAGGSLAGGNPAGGNPAGGSLAGGNLAGGNPAGGSLAGGQSFGIGQVPGGARSSGDVRRGIGLIVSGLGGGGAVSQGVDWLLGDRQLPDLRDVLMGSSFFYSRALGEDGQRREPGWLGDWAAWGETAATRFRGAEGPLSLDGEVATATLGADSRWGRWHAGVALAHSEGDGTYTAAGAGALSSTLTSLHPFARYEINERASVWGVLGYGAGELNLTPAGRESGIRTGVANTMAALGGRGVLSVRSAGAGQFELALLSDVLLTNTESDAVTGLVGTAGATNRARLMLEGSGAIGLPGGAQLRPTLEAGLRYDGGDAETGAGVELGGGLAYATGRLAVEVKGRTLLAHEDSEYEEWGVSGSVAYRPNADGRGLSVNLGSVWGAAQSGVSQLWSRPDASGLARPGTFQAAQVFQAEMGYGFETRNGRGLWYPYLGAESGDAGAQGLTIGFKLSSELHREMQLELGRRTNAPGMSENALALRGAIRW